MATVVEMPRLSDTMREGTIARWLKSEGERVSAGEALAEIETDKAVMTFDSFDDGVLLKVVLGEGETVALGTPICILGDEGEDVGALAEELAPKVKAAIEAAGGENGGTGEGGGGEPEEGGGEPEEGDGEPQEETDDERAEEADEDDVEAKRSGSREEAKGRADAEETAAPRAGRPDGGARARSAPVDDDGRRIRVSPLARRLAEEKGLDLRGVPGSGPHGRIVRRDVSDLEPARRLRPAAARPVPAETTVRVSQMRKTIAKRLVEAKRTAPHFYLTVTCDADRLASLREELNGAQERIRVSVNDLVMRAVVLTLLDHPEVNAAWEGNVVRRFGSVHLGFAVALEDGLITPVVRNAETLSLLELAEAARDLAERARGGTLESHEYAGNSFCVSNLGMFGIEHFTAIINPPAACILAVGALRDAAVVRDGRIVTGREMTLTLSCDHRVVDGAMGAAFLRDLRQVLEKPLPLVLG